MTTPDTPAQQKAREQYDTACRDLARAAAMLKEAQERYAEAFDRYNIAYGAARFAGVTTP